ncbi:ABC transporter substrate-binding protein [Cohnella faecalis]|nr:ABC transporter substrate-binding protein [Cohnella faecalis]
MKAKNKMIKGLTAILTAAFVLAGCQSGNEPTSAEASASAAAGTPTAGGQLNFALSTVIANDILDPQKTGSPQNSRIQRNIFDSLVEEQPDHTFKPWLATDWEIAPDNKSYTFHLRKDVKFHDGTPFNAEAVKFNFDRIGKLEAPGVAKNDIGSYTSSEVIDEYTIKIHFATPFAPFLTNLSKENLGIISPAAVQKYGDEFSHHPVGTGPFRFVSYTAGTEYVLEKNPDYNWPPSSAKHTGAAYLDKIVVKVIPEEATRVGVLQSGDVQAADIIPPQNIVSFKSDPNFQIYQAEMLNYNPAIHLNSKRPLLTDVKVREALRTSLDLDSIVKTVYLGTYDRAYTYLSPSLLGSDASLKDEWKSSIEDAGKALDELGWKKGSDGIRVKDGKRLSLEMIDFYANREKRMDVMALVQNQWKKNGIELKITSLSVGAYTERSKTGDFDLWIGSQYGADPDVFRSVANYFDFNDPELAKLLDQAYGELDREKRVAIYKQAQKRIFDQATVIPVYVFPYTVGASKSLQGLAFDAHGFPLFYDAWLKK